VHLIAFSPIRKLVRVAQNARIDAERTRALEAAAKRLDRLYKRLCAN
jgi:hypothetical protein